MIRFIPYRAVRSVLRQFIKPDHNPWLGFTPKSHQFLNRDSAMSAAGDPDHFVIYPAISNSLLLVFNEHQTG